MREIRLCRNHLIPYLDALGGFGSYASAPAARASPVCDSANYLYKKMQGFSVQMIPRQHTALCSHQGDKVARSEGHRLLKKKVFDRAGNSFIFMQRMLQ